MALQDAYQTRMIQHLLVRRSVDLTNVDVRVIHGVCYMRGSIQKLRTHPEVDLEQESEIIQKMIRQQTGIRDVVWEVRERHTGLERMRGEARANR